MAQNIRFVGIDIGKFDFFVFCSVTGQISAYTNTESGHEKLIKWLGSLAGTLIALEPTGGYRQCRTKSDQFECKSALNRLETS